MLTPTMFLKDKGVQKGVPHKNTCGSPELLRFRLANVEIAGSAGYQFNCGSEAASLNPGAFTRMV